MFIPDPDVDFLPIPDPGFGSATLVITVEVWRATATPVPHLGRLSTVPRVPRCTNGTVLTAVGTKFK
jgi:hypothetical protein